MKKTYYYHSPSLEGERRHTVAGVLENGKMSIGVASCSKDDAFIKAKGRQLALERAVKAENGVLLIGKNKHVGIAFRAIAVGVVSSLMSNKFIFNQ